jgi:hypothetical protein
VKLRLGSAVAGTVSVQIRIRSNFDIKLFEIAVEHEREALEARARAGASEDGSNEVAQAFDAS